MQKNDDRFLINSEKRTHFSHLMIPEFMETYQTSLYRAKMKDRPDRRSRFFHMTQLLRLTRGIPGFTAEAGVYRGLSSWLICHYLRQENPQFQGESHFMFDSFEGLSEPVEQDGEFPRKKFTDGGFTKTSLELVGETLAEFPKGWIPDVFEEIPEQKYRFVHVDVDVYQPTLDSLRYFFPLLSIGGIIVVDDFGPWEDNNWPGCIHAVNEFSNEIGLNFANLDSGNVFFIKR